MHLLIRSKGCLKKVYLNRRKAIRERCLNCAAWIPKEVSNCDFKDCFLFPFKSGKGKQSPKERQRAIRGYCKVCMNGQRSEVINCSSFDCSLFPYRKKGVDKTVKTESLFKKDQIEPVSETKIKNEYLRSI